jgi:hypothetical protein
MGKSVPTWTDSARMKLISQLLLALLVNVASALAEKSAAQVTATLPNNLIILADKVGF